MKNENIAASSGGDNKGCKANTALAVYFALGLFAVLTCDNYFGVLSVSLTGNGREYLTYGVGCFSARLRQILSP